MTHLARQRSVSMDWSFCHHRTTHRSRQSLVSMEIGILIYLIDFLTFGSCNPGLDPTLKECWEEFV